MEIFSSYKKGFILAFFFSKMSIISPTTCGFAKVAVFNALTGKTVSKKKGENKKDRCNRQFDFLLRQFSDNVENFNFEFKSFIDYFPKLLTNMAYLSKSKKTSADKVTILKVFSENNWIKLTVEQKQTHTLYECNGCMKDPQFKKIMGLFHNQTKEFKCIAKAKGIDLQNAKQKAGDAIKKLDNEFYEEFNITFTQAHKSILGLEDKENHSPAELKKHDT